MDLHQIHFIAVIGSEYEASRVRNAEEYVRELNALGIETEPARADEFTDKR